MKKNGKESEGGGKEGKIPKTVGHDGCEGEDLRDNGAVPGISNRQI